MLSWSTNVIVVPGATVSVTGEKLSAWLLPTPCGIVIVTLPDEPEPVEPVLPVLVLVLVLPPVPVELVVVLPGPVLLPEVPVPVVEEPLVVLELLRALRLPPEPDMET